MVEEVEISPGVLDKKAKAEYFLSKTPIDGSGATFMIVNDRIHTTFNSIMILHHFTSSVKRNVLIKNLPIFPSMFQGFSRSFQLLLLVIMFRFGILVL